MERKETDDVKRLSILDGLCGIKCLCPARRTEEEKKNGSLKLGWAGEMTTEKKRSGNNR